MLIEDTFRKLNPMKMHGLVKALAEQLDDKQYGKLAFDERVSLLVDREWSDRQNRRLQAAKLREQACIEDLDYRAKRGLDRRHITRVATCKWIAEHENVIICGPTGIGKKPAVSLMHRAARSAVACALRTVFEVSERDPHPSSVRPRKRRGPFL